MKNQSVKKGDVLVSGNLRYNNDPSDKTNLVKSKGIIIGKNGEMVKRIGKNARIDMEQNFGVKVNLKTWVKVKEDWQENDSIVNKFKLK